jgi:hypothetical protein
MHSSRKAARSFPPRCCLADPIPFCQTGKTLDRFNPPVRHPKDKMPQISLREKSKSQNNLMDLQQILVPRKIFLPFFGT